MHPDHKDGATTQAEADIMLLKMDRNFMAALTDKFSPGHDDALKIWTDAHKKACPVQEPT